MKDVTTVKITDELQALYQQLPHDALVQQLSVRETILFLIGSHLIKTLEIGDSGDGGLILTTTFLPEGKNFKVD